MDNETVTDYNPSYYVKFNSNTGKILQMSMTPIPDEEEEDIIVIETYNSMAREVLSGKRSRRTIGPVFDIENRTWDIGAKSNVLIIKELSSRLLEVTNEKANTNVDIGIQLFKENLQLEIVANYHVIKKNMNLADIADISKSSDNSLLNLYFTKKGDPDYLIESVQVDPMILLHNRKLKYSLSSDITKHADLDNISIFTRPIFHSYGLQVLDRLVESDYYMNKQQVLQVAGTSDTCHVMIMNHGDTVKIQSFVVEMDNTAPRTKNVRFVVCDGEIDAPVGSFLVSTPSLYSGESFEVDIDFKWPRQPLIVYRSKGLVANYLGDTYGRTN